MRGSVALSLCPCLTNSVLTIGTKLSLADNAVDHVQNVILQKIVQ